jgi:hypothetical protein
VPSPNTRSCPRYNFSAYLNLLCTNRSIFQKISSICREDYLPGLIFHFDDMARLRRFRKVCSRTNLQGTNVRVAVHSVRHCRIVLSHTSLWQVFLEALAVLQSCTGWSPRSFRQKYSKH